MRIVLDLQGAQSSGSRHRGIGRYSMWLAQALARQRGNHELILALNAAFPESVDEIRAAFANLLPPSAIVQWRPPTPVQHADPANTWRRQCAEAIRESFLASLRPDMVVVSSLFEGHGDDVVSSIGTLSSTVRTSVILYDLIPFIYRHVYLRSPTVETWYESKVDHLRRTDLLMAISESSASEAIEHLGIEPERCVSISAATDPRFRVEAIPDEARAHLLARFGIVRPYVMYTGGIDHRKNVEGLIRAYAMLSTGLRQTHQLVVVCSVQPEVRDRLNQLARDQGLAAAELVMTGFVDEADLVALYNLCELFVFPSWHEGFGLPALEAMACGRAVIAAATSSLPEVVGRDDALFDPHDDAAIAGKITEVLTNPPFQADLERHGLARSKTFSWDGVARRALAAIEAAVERPAPELTAPARRPRMAFLSPLPPERSGISDYSAQLLRELSRYYRVDVVVAQASVVDPWIQANCAIRSVDWFRAHFREFDRVLYHVGNSTFHQHMFAMLEEIPGVVVLHDFFLGNIAAHMDLTGATPGFFSNRLYRSHGYGAVQARFSAVDPKDVSDIYPCNLDVLRHAVGVITHSQASKQLAADWYGATLASDITVIPLLKASAVNGQRLAARRALGIAPSTLLVCSFGLLGPTKLNHRLLNAWYESSLSSAEESSILLFVGENDGGPYGASIVEVMGAADRQQQRASVRITGWVDATDFQRYLAAADVAVQLRSQSRGEASAAVVDCMSHGIPTIVNAHGSLAELDNDCVWKLNAEFEDAELVAALDTLGHNAEHRRSLGERARDVIRTRHAPRDCAARYESAIEAMYRRHATGVPALIDEITRHVPPELSPSAMASLAEAIDESIPPLPAAHHVYVDVSAVVARQDAVPEPVARMLVHWITQPAKGHRIEPVFCTAQGGGYRYARRWTLRLLGCPDTILDDDRLVCRSGDTLLLLLPVPVALQGNQAPLEALRRNGVTLKAFVGGPRAAQQRLGDDRAPSREVPLVTTDPSQWLPLIAATDGAVCESSQTAAALQAALDAANLSAPSATEIHPLSCDLFASDAQVRAAAIAQLTELLTIHLGGRGIQDEASCNEKQAGSAPSAGPIAAKI